MRRLKCVGRTAVLTVSSAIPHAISAITPAVARDDGSVRAWRGRTSSKASSQIFVWTVRLINVWNVSGALSFVAFIITFTPWPCFDNWFARAAALEATMLAVTPGMISAN
jgi:hypothetical protein